MDMFVPTLNLFLSDVMVMVSNIYKGCPHISSFHNNKPQ